MGGANTQQVASKGTSLNPSQEAQFQQWKAVNRPNDSGQDYDLRGAWLAQVKPDGRNHISDEFKFQNHPTFSIGSKYQDAQHWGGKWSALPNGKTAYEPAKWMEQDRQRMDFLNEYMKREEPNSILIRRAEPVGIKPLPETNRQTIVARLAVGDRVPDATPNSFGRDTSRPSS
jgi:hypothetical protein